jgi:hypothetical protein
MESELAERTYIPLDERPKKELLGIAEQLDIDTKKLPPNLSKAGLAYKIKVEQTKRNLKAEQEAAEQLRAEKLAELNMKTHHDRKPSFEEVAIYGGMWKGKKYKPSRKRLYRFINTEDRYQDAKFTKGGILFHIFECDKFKNPIINCLPEVLVAKGPKFEEFKSISITQRGIPIFADREVSPGRVRSVVIGYSPRFEFTDQGPAPDNAPWGPYLPEEIQEGETNDPDE